MEGFKMRVLVAYFSKTGNTKMMAETIAQSVEENGCDVVLKRIEDATPEDMLEADGVIIGSPTYYGTAAGAVKSLFDESVKYHGKLDGKVGAAFTSCGIIGGGSETAILSILYPMLVHGMIIQGDPKIGHFGVVAVKTPDDAVLNDCKRLGERVANLIKKLK